jgi:hypothetical protein
VGGSRSKPAGHGLDWLNAAPDADIRAALSACCAADSWVSRVGGGRPYPDEDALYAASAAATAALDDAGKINQLRLRKLLTPESSR